MLVFYRNYMVIVQEEYYKTKSFSEHNNSANILPDRDSTKVG